MIGTRGLPATFGGVEHAVESLSRSLTRLGHQVTVYGRRGYCAEDETEFEGVHQIALPLVNSKHLEAITHTTAATAHAVASRRFDVIHYHATGPALLSVVPRSLGIPTVATVHGLDWKREKWGAVASRLLRVGAHVAATVPAETVVVSRELRRLLLETYDAQTTYIANGVDLSQMTDEEPVAELVDRSYALFLGRLVPEKQVDVLISAFRRVAGDHRLAIVGPSSHSDAYVEAVAALAAEDERVLLLGPRYGAEKTWLLRNARVFVQPSSIEGLPIALLEALSQGGFTIVSDIPENVEAVTVGTDPYGMVFRVGDDRDLANKLDIVLNGGPALLDAIPRVSTAIAAKHDWHRIAVETELVYRQAMLGGRRRRSRRSRERGTEPGRRGTHRP